LNEALVLNSSVRRKTFGIRGRRDDAKEITQHEVGGGGSEGICKERKTKTHQKNSAAQEVRGAPQSGRGKLPLEREVWNCCEAPGGRTSEWGKKDCRREVVLARLS